MLETRNYYSFQAETEKGSRHDVQLEIKATGRFIFSKELSLKETGHDLQTNHLTTVSL